MHPLARSRAPPRWLNALGGSDADEVTTVYRDKREALARLSALRRLRWSVAIALQAERRRRRVPGDVALRAAANS